MSSDTPQTNKETEREVGYLDQTLRPSRWADYIGQKGIKDNLHILLTAAQERKHPPEHILFYGPPGLDVGSLLSGFVLGAIHQAYSNNPAAVETIVAGSKPAAYNPADANSQR